jgi:serine/threonine-protein kinase RsbW
MNADSFHLNLPTLPESLGVLAESLHGYAEAHDWPAGLTLHVDLVLEELVCNTISYGYADGRPGQVTVGIWQEGDTLHIRIDDDGDAFNPFDHAEPDTALDIDSRAIGGLGIHFVRKLMDSYAYQRIGQLNRISLVKRVETGIDPL